MEEPTSMLVCRFHFWQEDNKGAAIQLYQSSADKGHIDAMIHLAWCFHHGYGIGVHQDKRRAVSIYRLLAKRGSAEGQLLLGLCYRYGIGVRKSLVQAVHMWFVAGDVRTDPWFDCDGQRRNGQRDHAPNAVARKLHAAVPTGLWLMAARQNGENIKKQNPNAEYYIWDEPILICSAPHCLNTKNLRLCDGCGIVFYCNIDCQRNHWLLHKELCNGVSAPLRLPPHESDLD
jgi:hypothetical protein